MTTFQALVDAFLSALSHLVPLSETVLENVSQTVFHWPTASHEIHLLVVSMGVIAFLTFFRFDWLGMISAFLKSVARPLSLKPEERNLDQHTLLFLLIISLPHLIGRRLLAPVVADSEILNHPLFLAAASALLAFGFHFSHRWNKRIHGLNHLKLIDAVPIAILGLFSCLPIFPYIGMLWIGFALNNYHTEAIFKYSMLALGIDLIAELISLWSSIGVKSAMETIGHLNSVAVFVVSFTVFWIGLENLQKNLSEATYKSFKWVSLCAGIFFVVVYFINRG